MNDDLPAPLEIVEGDREAEALRAMYPPDGLARPTDPLGAATLWVLAINEGLRNAFDYLTFDPESWPDESLPGLSTMLEGSGFKQNVDYAAGDEGSWIAHVSLPAGVKHSMQSFGAFPMDGWWVTLLRCEDGIWRVWSIHTDQGSRASTQSIIDALQ